MMMMMMMMMMANKMSNVGYFVTYAKLKYIYDNDININPITTYTYIHTHYVFNNSQSRNIYVT
jgi:hypothetical protein